MIERGIVVGSGAEGVSVRVEASEACGGCGHCGRSGSGMLMTDVLDALGARPGDTVEVELSAKGNMLAGVFVYALPVAGLLLGYVLGWLAGPRLGAQADAAGALGALAVAGAALAGGRKLGSGALSSERYRAKVRAIIARGQDGKPA